MKAIAPRNQQLSLFSPAAPAQGDTSVPAAVQQALDLGAAMAVSVSGGKDSDAMLRHLTALHQSQGWTGQLFAITADLGRIEWPGTLEHIQSICAKLGVTLVTVRRQKGSMIDRWDERRQVLISQQEAEEGAIARCKEDSNSDLLAIAPLQEGNKPFWSSSTARYCTKEMKTAEVDRYLRRFNAVVCAVGIRAEESSSRAKKPHFQVRNDITTSALKASKGLNADQHEEWATTAIARWIESNFKGRLALTWNAVLDWPIEKVWESLGTSVEALEQRRTLYQSGSLTAALRGWPAHWAYVSGNSRLSCSMCVLASAYDIQNGAKHNARTWIELALMEKQSGWSFQQGKWLSTLDIEVSKQIQASERLAKVLCELGLVKQWNLLFTIALLRTTPLAVSMLWQNQALEAIAAIVNSKRVCGFKKHL